MMFCAKHADNTYESVILSADCKNSEKKHDEKSNNKNPPTKRWIFTIGETIKDQSLVFLKIAMMSANVFFLTANHNTANVAIATATTPAIVMPAIAPPDKLLSGVGITVKEIVAFPLKQLTSTVCSPSASDAR